MRERWTRWTWIVVALCAFAGAPSLARADDEEQARAHFRLGQAHYSNGDFLKAAAEFEEAYAIYKRPALLYNIYLAYRDANDTARAADALRRYLAEEQDIDNRGQLEARLANLEKSLAAEQTAPPASEPAPAPQAAPAPIPTPPAAEPSPAAESTGEPAATTTPEPEYDEPAAEGTNLVPFIVMGVGGAMVVGSLVTGAMASSAQSELEDKCPERTGCDASLQDTQSRGETLALVTDVLLFGGIAVAGTGVVLFFLGGDDAPSDDVAFAAACAPGKCGGAMRMRF